MVIKRERLRVPVPRAAEMHIYDELRQDYPGLINDVRSGYWNALSLNFQGSGEGVSGEVYFPTGGAVLYYRVDPNRQYIEAGCMMPDDEGAQAFQGFCERIREAVWPGKADTQRVPWSALAPTSSSFDMVTEEGQRFNPPTQQLDAARALADPKRRQMLSTIQARRSVLLENLANDGTSTMEVAQEVHLLESLGLLQKDFVVFCREQGNQISRVQSFNEIEEATRRGFKCFSCGRPMAEERIDQLLSCTPAGTQLARPNYWLTLLLSQTLEKMGIRRDKQVTVGASEGSRIIDLFAGHDGFLMMFEVREEDVRLDDIYLFLSRVRYYRPDAAFYVTTCPVSTEVRQYLASAECEARVLLVEQEEGVGAAVSDVLKRSMHARFREVVRELEPQTRVDVGALVYEFFFGKEVPKSDERPAVVGKHGEPSGLEMLAEPPKPAEEHVPTHDVPSLEEKTAASGVAESAPIAVVETPSETASEHPPLAAMLEPAHVQDMAMELMQEELIDQPILEIQEVYDMGDMGDMGGVGERGFSDEDREHAMRRVIDDVSAHGVLGRADALAALLVDVNAIPSFSSALVTDDGFMVAESLKGELAPDMLAAVAVELHDQVQRSLEEFDGGRASRIRIESMADRLHLRPAGNKTILVVREERPPREQDEEMAGALPGEMVLREAMLKKVLEDLSMVEGVRGGIVASRDGLAIDYAIENEVVPADALAAVLSLIVVDSERLCKKLHLHPIRQISFSTDDCAYSLIPLDKEGILITMIDPGTPREVWQNRLYGAANMLTSVFQ